MSRECQVTGRRSGFGNRVETRGLAKAKGGVGIKTTGITPRRFHVNLQWKRVWVPELNRFVRVRVSPQALRTMGKNGAFRTLLDAGLVKPPKRVKKKPAEPAAGVAAAAPAPVKPTKAAKPAKADKADKADKKKKS